MVIPQFAQAEIGLTTVPLRWQRGISSRGLGVTDSLVISLPGPGAAVDFADTTEWLDLSNYQFTQGYSAYPLVIFTVYGQANTASDSIGYQVQYADQKDIPQGNFAISNTFGTLASVAYLSLSASTTVGANVWGTVVALAPTTSVYAHRWYRLVVLNAEVGGTIGRRYCGVTATIVGRKN
jgi:hypothetical protein